MGERRRGTQTGEPHLPSLLLPTLPVPVLFQPCTDHMILSRKGSRVGIRCLPDQVVVQAPQQPPCPPPSGANFSREGGVGGSVPLTLNSFATELAPEGAGERGPGKGGRGPFGAGRISLGGF